MEFSMALRKVGVDWVEADTAHILSNRLVSKRIRCGLTFHRQATPVPEEVRAPLVSTL